MCVFVLHQDVRWRSAVVFTLGPAGSAVCLCSGGDKNILFTQLAASVEALGEAQLCLYTVEVEMTGSNEGEKCESDHSVAPWKLKLNI